MNRTKGSNPEKKKEKPKRMCAVCREMDEKGRLYRIVRTPEGGIEYDPGGRKNGRGVYLCGKEACLKKAQKQGIPDKHLKAAVPQEIYQLLAEEIRNNG